MAAHSGDAIEKQNVGDALMGKASPFSAHSLLNGLASVGGRGETGGGTGDKYKPEIAQKILDAARDVNIYASNAFG